jgi:DNA-3-methyladenine glycosylase II
MNTNILEEAITKLRKDKVLRKFIDDIDLPDRTKKESIFISLLGSIVSQQLSTKAAATIYSRFLDLFPKRKPTPKLVIEMDHGVLRNCGLSNQKASYVKNLSEFFLIHPIENKHWDKHSDEELIEKLSSIKGIGKWTVQMTLMFTLDRHDILPVDDLIIRNSIVKYYGIESDGKIQIEEIYKVAEKWRPYRTIASMYLWAAKDNLKS